MMKAAADILPEVARAVEGGLDPVSVLDAVLDALWRGRGYFWIGIYRREGGELVRQAFRGLVPPCDRFPLGKGNVGTAGATGRLKVIPDVTQDPAYQMCFLETRSEIVVPIMRGGEIVGVIDVESDRLDAFGAEDRELLAAVAERIAPAVAGGHPRSEREEA